MHSAVPIAMLGVLLSYSPGISGQHGSQNHTGSFHGGHVGSFSSEGFRGGFSAPHSIGVAPARRGFGSAPRMSPPRTLVPHSLVPRQGRYSGFRPQYRAGTRD